MMKPFQQIENSSPTTGSVVAGADELIKRTHPENCQSTSMQDAWIDWMKTRLAVLNQAATAGLRYNAGVLRVAVRPIH